MKTELTNRIYKIFFAFLVTTIFITSSKAFAEDSSTTLLNSDPQKLAKGIGHFERSRSLLLAAIREFDAGYKYVKPDQVLDTDMWRSSILTRASELETMLSPRPREANTGIKYEADPRLIGERKVPEAKLKK